MAEPLVPSQVVVNDSITFTLTSQKASGLSNYTLKVTVARPGGNTSKTLRIDNNESAIAACTRLIEDLVRAKNEDEQAEVSSTIQAVAAVANEWVPTSHDSHQEVQPLQHGISTPMFQPQTQTMAEPSRAQAYFPPTVAPVSRELQTAPPTFQQSRTREPGLAAGSGGGDGTGQVERLQLPSIDTESITLRAGVVADVHASTPPLSTGPRLRAATEMVADNHSVATPSSSNLVVQRPASEGDGVSEAAILASLTKSLAGSKSKPVGDNQRFRPSATLPPPRSSLPVFDTAGSHRTEKIGSSGVGAPVQRTPVQRESGHTGASFVQPKRSIGIGSPHSELTQQHSVAPRQSSSSTETEKEILASFFGSISSSKTRK